MKGWNIFVNNVSIKQQEKVVYIGIKGQFMKGCKKKGKKCYLDMNLLIALGLFCFNMMTNLDLINY